MAQGLNLASLPHFTAIFMIPRQDNSYASSRQESQRPPLSNKVLAFLHYPAATIRACGPDGRSARWAVLGSNIRLV
ncbi:hypothetical protein MCOR02_003123 [Pyricularia oryzae]|uniref:Uncharacterized protein n=1 Tax=Pyricularia oryzae (strain 70-15 / ATCC MYA-4617 / FGSC 8958) TaxID=242507 RepID=G4MT54_PYRO7|nr:uncharacterized protein MGG_15859 [Pyricularia oryzae 70-15]EHA55519.1 hypothetical protein MGG_15859 [Pyricularia oryzae 70-15]KAH9439577.1 hypothetical protein MCOR02_003123 [Pyricularia oryzae]